MTASTTILLVAMAFLAMAGLMVGVDAERRYRSRQTRRAPADEHDGGPALAADLRVPTDSANVVDEVRSPNEDVLPEVDADTLVLHPDAEAQKIILRNAGLEGVTVALSTVALSAATPFRMRPVLPWPRHNVPDRDVEPKVSVTIENVELPIEVARSLFEVELNVQDGPTASQAGKAQDRR